MKNYIQTGEYITITASTDIDSGAGVLVGSLFGVAQTSATSGNNVALLTTGVVQLPKSTSQAFAVGVAVYWNDGNKIVTTTPTNNTKIGVAVLDAISSEATAQVRLNGSF